MIFALNFPISSLSNHLGFLSQQVLGPQPLIYLLLLISGVSCCQTVTSITTASCSQFRGNTSSTTGARLSRKQLLFIQHLSKSWTQDKWDHSRRYVDKYHLIVIFNGMHTLYHHSISSWILLLTAMLCKKWIDLGLKKVVRLIIAERILRFSEMTKI